MMASLNHLCLFGFSSSCCMCSLFCQWPCRFASSTSALPAASVTLHTQAHRKMQTMASFDKGRFDGRMKSWGLIWLLTEEKGRDGASGQCSKIFCFIFFFCLKYVIEKKRITNFRLKTRRYPSNSTLERGGGNTWQLPGRTQEIRTENIRKQTFSHQTFGFSGKGRRESGCWKGRRSTASVLNLRPGTKQHHKKKVHPAALTTWKTVWQLDDGMLPRVWCHNDRFWAKTAP